MKCVLLFLLSILIAGNTVTAQNCFTEGISFTSQEDIDNFLILNPNCTQIQGDVSIQQNASTPITNLLGLSNVAFINGNLRIRFNNELINLSGLENLNSITGYLLIESCEALTNLSGLDELTSTSSLLIESNTGLVSLSGLGSLTSVEEDVKLNKNYNLLDLVGLEGLTTINRSLEISRCDALPSLAGLENITSIAWNLYIAQNEALTSLSALVNITSIGYDLTISGSNLLSSLSGLENISTVENNVRIASLQISNFSDLANLTSIGGHLQITGNPVLSSLSGLEGLTSLNNYLFISGNDSLSTLTGLENLSSVGGYLSIRFNPLLSSLNGLENLTTVDEHLIIEENELLSSFSGLEGLTSVGDYFFIQNNEVLSSLLGLENLISIGGYLLIQANPELASLSSLEILTTVDGAIQIKNNEALTYCSINSVCQRLNNLDILEISENATGCNDEDEIAVTCDNVGRIMHPIFYDIDENGIINDGEPFYPFGSVTIEPGGYISYGNLQNGGSSYRELGDYTVTYNSIATPHWDLTTNITQEISLSDANLVDTVYFGLTPNLILSDIETSIVTANLRCLEFQSFNIYGTNTGTTILDGTLWLEIDPEILSVEYIDVPDTIVASNLYGWYFTDLLPGSHIHKEINLEIPGPPDFPLGDSIGFKAYINYDDSDGTHLSRIFNYTDQVLCSYDPNDKLVNPIYPSNYALIGEPLVYTIRFQNTGNAEAYDVVIRDTINSYLDPSTFRVITSSHDSKLTTELKDELYLNFNFFDIYLPDSTANFEESQGFVMYTINAYGDIPELTEITNTAGIYFDSNPPVITNTTENTMVYSFDVDQDGFDIFVDCDDLDATIYPGAVEIPNNLIDEDCDGEDLIFSQSENLQSIVPTPYPNPTSGIFSLDFSTKIEGILSVKDCTGKTLLKQAVKQENQIDINALPDGIYFLEVKTENGVWLERIVKF